MLSRFDESVRGEQNAGTCYFSLTSCFSGLSGFLAKSVVERWMQILCVLHLSDCLGCRVLWQFPLQPSLESSRVSAIAILHALCRLSQEQHWALISKSIPALSSCSLFKIAQLRALLAPCSRFCQVWWGTGSTSRKWSAMTVSTWQVAWTAFSAAFSFAYVCLVV